MHASLFHSLKYYGSISLGSVGGISAIRVASHRVVLLLPILLCLTVLSLGCSKDSKEELIGPGAVSLERGWVDLGFEDHYAIQIELSWPYLYAAAGSEGLFRRRADDANALWECIGFADTTDSPNYRGAQDVVVLSTGDILVGLNQGIPHSAGLYRSADNGDTWHRSDSGIADEEAPYAGTIVRLARHSAGDQTVYAAGYGLYRSDDAGEAWSLIWGYPAGGGMFFKALMCHPSSSSVLWAGGGTSSNSPTLVTSSDGGQTWERSNVELVVQGLNEITGIAVDPVDASTAYVGLARGGLLKTTDGGESWAHAGALSDVGITAIEADNATPGRIFIADWWGVYESLDGGETAEKLDCPTPEGIRAMVYDEPRSSLYVGTKAGIIRYIPS